MFLDDDVVVGPQLAGRPGRRPRPAGRCRRRAGRHLGAAADGPPADRLGTRHRRSGRRRGGSPRTSPTGGPRCSAVGGFDERFRRAFREDADLALRLQDRGYRLVDGRRQTTHPVRPARWDASLRQQRGNADDVLMRRLHGRGWHRRAEAPVGRRPLHLATTAAGATALAAAVIASSSGRRGGGGAPGWPPRRSSPGPGSRPARAPGRDRRAWR